MDVHEADMFSDGFLAKCYREAALSFTHQNNWAQLFATVSVRSCASVGASLIQQCAFDVLIASDMSPLDGIAPVGMPHWLEGYAEY
jgi:hypothetical protein